MDDRQAAEGQSILARWSARNDLARDSTFRDSRVRMGWKQHGAGVVLLPPPAYRFKNGLQVAALICQHVLVAQGFLLINAAGDKPRCLQPFQAIRKDVGRNIFR